LAGRFVTCLVPTALPLPENLITIDIFLSIFDIESLVRHSGLLILWMLIYASSGLFFCFFVPSGAILFTAGVFTATGDLHYDSGTISIMLILASVLGNLTGYWFGLQAGPALYKREDSRFYKKQYLNAAEMFYEKYGKQALIIAYFLPVIRAFAPIVAGVIKMNFRQFMVSTILGAVISVLGFVSAGYFIGSRPFLKPWLNYIVLLFLLIVTSPLIVRVFRTLKRK
jgi:membrane-associated protein